MKFFERLPNVRVITYTQKLSSFDQNASRFVIAERLSFGKERPVIRLCKYVTHCLQSFFVFSKLHCFPQAQTCHRALKRSLYVGKSANIVRLFRARMFDMRSLQSCSLQRIRCSYYARVQKFLNRGTIYLLGAYDMFNCLYRVTIYHTYYLSIE